MEKTTIVKLARQTGKTRSLLTILSGKKIEMKSVKIEESEF